MLLSHGRMCYSIVDFLSTFCCVVARLIFAGAAIFLFTETGIKAQQTAFITSDDVGPIHNQICEQVGERLKDFYNCDFSSTGRQPTREELLQIIEDEMLTLCDENANVFATTNISDKDKDKCVDNITRLTGFYDQNPLLYGPAQSKFDVFFEKMKSTGTFDEELFFNDIAKDVLGYLCTSQIMLVDESDEWVCPEEFMEYYERIIASDPLVKNAIRGVFLGVNDNIYKLSLPDFGFGDKVEGVVNDVADEFVSLMNSQTQQEVDREDLLDSKTTIDIAQSKIDIIKSISSIAGSSTSLWTSIPFRPTSGYFQALMKQANDDTLLEQILSSLSLFFETLIANLAQIVIADITGGIFYSIFNLIFGLIGLVDLDIFSWFFEGAIYYSLFTLLNIFFAQIFSK